MRESDNGIIGKMKDRWMRVIYKEHYREREQSCVCFSRKRKSAKELYLKLNHFLWFVTYSSGGMAYRKPLFSIMFIQFWYIVNDISNILTITYWKTYFMCELYLAGSRSRSSVLEGVIRIRFFWLEVQIRINPDLRSKPLNRISLHYEKYSK